MAKYIKPTFSFTANANSATTDPGPMSFGLTLSTTPDADASGRLTVDVVEQDVITVTTATTNIVDGSAHIGSGVGGTDGCWMYLKNITVSGSYQIYIGIVADGDTSDIAADGTGTSRAFTLNRGEFAFFPYDYTGDITVETDNNGSGDTVPKLEMWRFDRG